jgi:hypothetical protein
VISQAAVPERFARHLLRSVLPGVTDVAWNKFVRAMSVQTIRDVSARGGIGSFDLPPRRLGELEVMVNLRRADGGKWQVDLVPRYGSLGEDAILQGHIFSLSMKRYDEEIGRGDLVLPEGVSRSGALGILHCGGRGALCAWPETRFESTRATFSRTNGIF